MKQPPLITYNLKERGRVHRGQPRNFNIQALCDSINGPGTQEKVKTRAMLGYYGHKPRILLDSLEVAESVVVKGVYNEIVPAIVTTYLEAFPDGTIKHQTEFLDSVSGKKAAEMFANRIGGFSSAIDERNSNFAGFDYVLDPNFSTNRGFSLDSAGLTLDEVMLEISNEQDEFWLALLANKDSQISTISAALDSATVENEELLSLLAKSGANCAGNVFDSAAIKPFSVSMSKVNQLQKDRDFFRQAAQLPVFVEKLTENTGEDGSYDDLLNRLGYR